MDEDIRFGLPQTKMLKAQLFINKEEQKGSKSLHQFIMEFLIQQGIVGATVVRGHAGFGSKRKLKQPDLLFSFDETPMIITFIDEEMKVKRVLKGLGEQTKSALIITSAVEKFEP